MGTGLPPKWPPLGGSAGRNALTGAVSDLFPLYTSPPSNALTGAVSDLFPQSPPSPYPYASALAALAALSPPSAAPGRNALAGAASDLFPQYPPPPYPYASGLAAFGALSPLSPASSLLFGAPATPTSPWHYVRWRFGTFLANLAITSPQREDGNTKQAGVRACLNRQYYGTSSEIANSLLIGSWGKGTQVRPSRDLDILFLVPASVWQRYEQRDGNKQSQLLQEVKEVLAATYSQTTMRGDGQVISIPFNTMPVELSPGFRCQDGSIIICDTNEGGRYKTSTAEVEESELIASDQKWNGNTRALAQMLKQWQREQNAPLCWNVSRCTFSLNGATATKMSFITIG
jgi:Second Messenger Oligonucleotide or Dinucleotide Synthetase domain